MKKIVPAILLIAFFGCKKNEENKNIDFSTLVLTEYDAVPVTKTSTKKVFVHLMPWFETKETNTPANTWGMHWRMNTRNPDNITGGKRDIASYYYPLTGPYASGDKDLIEYQLLLMKLSGIDGVFFDWPGTLPVNDYALMVRNTEKMIDQLNKVGLKFAIVYEDQNLINHTTNYVTQAQADMNYMASHYFSKSNYETVNGQPLLMCFGPQAIMDPAQWTSVFSVLSPRPAFVPLWYKQGFAGANAAGQFAWVVQGNTNSLSSFYNSSSSGIKITAAYPGFKDYYTAGGWPDNINWEIAYNGTGTFSTTLDMALATSNPYLQLVTWNDYGEGTMIEPTNEFGYGFLTLLQQKLGVSTFTQADLENVKKLFDMRKAYASNTTYQKALSQVFYYMVSLQMNKAKEILDQIN